MGALKGTTYRRCGCKAPETGKPLNQKCPELARRGHGTWTLDTRIPVTDPVTGEIRSKRLKRAGYKREKDASAALDKIGDLLKLATGDPALRARIGDLIDASTRRGGDLPDIDEIRRRTGAGADVAAPSVTVAQALTEWLAGKRALKVSVKDSYEQHIRDYLIPLLGDLPRDKLRPEHIAGMIDTIGEWNEELQQAKQEGREPHLPGNVRPRPRVVGNATQHRIFATLRNAYNDFVRRPGMLDWNPCLAIELPPERRGPATVWSPEQTAMFLARAEQEKHRYRLLYRIVLLLGPRRGEACALQWGNLDEGWADPEIPDLGITIDQELLERGGHGIYFDTPKSQAGKRWMPLDIQTRQHLREHRMEQAQQRLVAGDLWQDHGLIFCREDGTPVSPGMVSWHFPRLAARAGLPQIKLHEGRHTAATLGLEAGLPLKVVSVQLGHSTTDITANLYQHVRREVLAGGAAQVLQLVTPKHKEEEEQEASS